MKSRSNSQLNLPPALLAKETQQDTARPKHTHADGTHELAAELFDQALTAAEISTAEVAYLFHVSESLVRRMRSKDARERVSFGQMLLLPPAFHIAIHRQLNMRFGFGKAALARLIGAAEDLALVVD